MASLLTATECKGGLGRLEDGSSFGRQLLESDMLGSDDFAVSGDSSLRLDACRDFPLLIRDVLVVGTSTSEGCASLGKYDRASLSDAPVDINCKVISFCMLSIIQVQAEGKLTSPLS